MSASRSARTFWVSALVVGLAATASAQAPEATPFTIKTPVEWPESPELASGIANQLGKAVDFGGLEKNGGAAAFVKPQTGIIYVTWLLSKTAADKPEEVVRITLDQLRKSAGDSATEIEYRETRAGQAIDVKMVWRDVANETLTMSRALVWRDTESKIRLLRAECLFSESDRDAVAPICGGALETLEATEITAGKVGELGSITTPGGPAGQVDAGAAAGSGDGKSGPSINAIDPKKPLYEAKPEEGGGIRDNLWLFVVGGVLIIFAFWAATRGRREENEDEDEGEGDAPAPPASEEEE